MESCTDAVLMYRCSRCQRKHKRSGYSVRVKFSTGMTEWRNSTPTMFYTSSESFRKESMELERKKKKYKAKKNEIIYIRNKIHLDSMIGPSFFFSDLRFVRVMTLPSRKTIPSSRDPEGRSWQRTTMCSPCPLRQTLHRHVHWSFAESTGAALSYPRPPRFVTWQPTRSRKTAQKGNAKSSHCCCYFPVARYRINWMTRVHPHGNVDPLHWSYRAKKQMGRS